MSDAVQITNAIANVCSTLIVMIGAAISGYLAYRMAILNQRQKAMQEDVRVIKGQTDGLADKLVATVAEANVAKGRLAESQGDPPTPGATTPTPAPMKPGQSRL